MYRIRIDLRGYRDKIFTVVAQCSMPVPTVMPRQGVALGIGQKDVVTMVRDVMLCQVPDELQRSQDFCGAVQIIGQEKKIFAVLPEQLLEILPGSANDTYKDDRQSLLRH